MENIIEPNNNFDFNNLSLAHPSGIQGGAYFTKIENNKKPLYIQTGKSLTRQGIVKSGKKYYCDLMFDKNSEVLINWFENLEEKCQKMIFEKKDSWFQNALEESDIESAFNSIIRVYKSGKYYLVRVNIKNTHVSEPSIKIYDENYSSLGLDKVTGDTDIVCILEIQGIKFTSRNFQIEIDLKQIMVLDKEPFFDKCLIKSTKNTAILTNQNVKEDFLNNNIPNTQDNVKARESLEENNKMVETNVLEDIENDNVDNVDNVDNSHLYVGIDKLDVDIDVDNNCNDFKNDLFNSNNDDLLELDIVDLNEELEEEPKELKEINVNVNLENNLESFTLKKPNQVYFELYKKAREKAKVAKKNAILAYLEAKNIKKTYLVENINDSDSDFDAEIEDISESELEGL